MGSAAIAQLESVMAESAAKAAAMQKITAKWNAEIAAYKQKPNI